MRQLGINVGLGTDGAASNNRLDMFGEYAPRRIAGQGSTGDASTLPAREVLRMATLDGATALGLGREIGSITPGKGGRPRRRQPQGAEYKALLRPAFASRACR